MRSPSMHKASRRESPLTFILTEPVVRALCSSSLGPPNDSSLDTALSIYKEIDLVTARDPGSYQRLGSPSAQQIMLYQTLLRALASSANKENIS